MKLKKYIEEKTSEWVGYQRPAVDWMVTEKGNSNSRLERTMHDFPEFDEVVRLIVMVYSSVPEASFFVSLFAAATSQSLMVPTM